MATNLSDKITKRDKIKTRKHKLEITYRDEKNIETQRMIRPIALSYRSTCILLAGWCELRNGLRHFRTDRIYGCNKLKKRFAGQGHVLRELWLTSYWVHIYHIGGNL